MSAGNAGLHRDLALIEQGFFAPLRALIGAGYFSLTVSGLEGIPRSRPHVLIANHAGWLPLDALMLGLALHDGLGPEAVPYPTVHRLLYRLPGAPACFAALGLLPASLLQSPVSLPPPQHPLLVFPEGEAGNCKPFWQAYQMRRWHCGCVRLAASRQALIVPVAILGGEESLPVAMTLSCLQPQLGTVLPLPLLGLPLPAVWHIACLPPIDILAQARRRRLDLGSHAGCHQLTAELRAQLQARLDRLSRGRPLACLGRLLGPAPTEPCEREDAPQRLQAL